MRTIKIRRAIEKTETFYVLQTADENFIDPTGCRDPSIDSALSFSTSEDAMLFACRYWEKVVTVRVKCIHFFSPAKKKS